MTTYNWNWPILLHDPYFGWIVSGFANTCLLAALAWVIAFPLGSAVGIARTTDSRALRLAGTTYVEVFRNIPLLVQMFLWYYVAPEMLPADWGHWVKREMPCPQFTTALICLGLYTASRVAEDVRSGIEAISRDQRFAAMALGFTPLQVYRYVVMPVAFRIIVPPLTSDFLGVFKSSSLALTIGVMELTAQARQIEVYTFAAFEAFTMTTALYCMVTGLVIVLMRSVERRTRVAGTIAVEAK